jgi:hypothetical protein
MKILFPTSQPLVFLSSTYSSFLVFYSILFWLFFYLSASSTFPQHFFFKIDLILIIYFFCLSSYFFSLSLYVVRTSPAGVLEPCRGGWVLWPRSHGVTRLRLSQPEETTSVSSGPHLP